MLEKELLRCFNEHFPKLFRGKTVGLIGDLGVGKTHLVRNLLSRFSSDFSDQVSSPTYNLCNIYICDDLEINHFDLYRIESDEELYDIGLWESMGNEETITVIEWVDLYDEVADRCDITIKISVQDDVRRYAVSSKEP
jgi:tRNA threonylcarbamoyladenosine biosynthesis protein TsaE